MRFPDIKIQIKHLEAKLDQEFLQHSNIFQTSITSFPNQLESAIEILLIHYRLCKSSSFQY